MCLRNIWTAPYPTTGVNCIYTSNISIVCILKKKVCSHIYTTSWRTSLKPREIIWPPAFNNFTEIGTIHSQSLLYRQNKYINIFREIYFTPSLTAFQVQCSPKWHLPNLLGRVAARWNELTSWTNPTGSALGAWSQIRGGWDGQVCAVRPHYLTPVFAVLHL